MQRAAKKTQKAIIILLMVLLFCGCGSEDVLDETNQRYETYVSFHDGGEEGVMTVDIDMVTDCNGDGVFDDGEFFTDLFADITITINDITTPGLEMTGYDITFRPLRSYDQLGNAISPPNVGIYHGNFDVNIPTLSEVEFSITCMEADLKIYMGSFLNAIDWVFRYEVTIDMHFVDDYGEDRDITVVRTLDFGAYNNC